MPPDWSDLRKALKQLRKRGAVPEREVRQIAEKMGYERVYGKRTNEPTWRLEGFPRLTIPGHKGDLKKGTANNIIDRLLDDLDRLENKGDEHNG